MKSGALVSPPNLYPPWSVPRGSFARTWKLSSRLFSRPDWPPLGLRGWRQTCLCTTWRSLLLLHCFLYNNCFGLFLAERFLFWKILNLNLTLTVCRKWHCKKGRALIKSETQLTQLHKGQLTFTFARDLSYISCILFTEVKITRKWKFTARYPYLSFFKIFPFEIFRLSFPFLGRKRMVSEVLTKSSFPAQPGNEDVECPAAHCSIKWLPM